jgi:type II secretory pathway pseudopilin PulG
MAHRGTNQTGYTLIELLLYVALVGILLTSVTFFFGLVADSRVKNQTINEVDTQGQAIMETITQTIRNATSVTTPAIGGSSPSLTLVVPTGSLSPTVFDLSGTALGYTLDGGTTDSSDKNNVNATKFVAGATGTVSALYGFVGPVVAASPNNLGQMAIYSGTTSPTTLLATSGSVALKPSAWNVFPISTVPVVSGQTYWLAYNTNGLATTDNNIRYHAGTSGQARFVAQTYGTWPASYTGTTQNNEFSVFAMIDPAGTPGSVRIKEGAGSVVPLSGNDVQLTGLNFRNLSRTGTPGIVQINFTLSQVNPLGKNEYDYQKSFTGSVELGW